MPRNWTLPCFLAFSKVAMTASSSASEWPPPVRAWGRHRNILSTMRRRRPSSISTMSRSGVRFFGLRMHRMWSEYPMWSFTPVILAQRP